MFCRSLTVAVCGLILIPLAGAAVAVQKISSDAGLTASVSSDGGYQVSASQYGWTFSGSTGQAVQNVNITDGSDGIGAWLEIGFDYGMRTSSIRLYNGHSIVLFTTAYNADSSNAAAFPHFTTFPQELSTFSYAGGWDNSFGRLNPHSPWLFFDDRANAFVFSPALNFMTGTNQMAADDALEGAIDSRISTLPAGFKHRSIIAFGHGVNDAFNAWGTALTGLSGKHRPANDAVTLLNKISYWTDAGAAYYYHPMDPTQYVPTLESVPPAFTHLGVPIASMELDSWYYQKGSPAWWGSNSGAGMDSFVADSTLFPNGLAAFQKTLGIPLITHARWIDVNSDLRNHYKMSGNVSIDPKYWKDYAAYLSANGVEVLEQDWLDDQAHTDFNLTDPDAFLDNMATQMAAAGRSLMYCMPLWGDVMQSSKYDNVLAVRISADFLNRSHWDQFLFNTPIASSVGLWPFTDAFNSANAKDILLSTLSAGPVASGDAVGAINGANLDQAVRADGVIVKPDVPVAPLDASFVAVSHSATAPVIASTYTDHPGHRTSYVLAYEHTPGALGAVAFTPSSLGMTGPVYVYDYFNGKGSLVHAGSQFTDSVSYSGSYYVVAPIGKSGMAFLGDAGKFVSNGKKRIEAVSDDGWLHATVRFAAQETSVTLHVYAPSKPYATVSSGGVSRVEHEGASLYRIRVSPGADGSATITIGLR